MGKNRPGGFWRSLTAGALWLTLGLGLALTPALPATGQAQTPTPGKQREYDPSPPSAPVKLIFIHPYDDFWLTIHGGGLGAALRDNNYYVSGTAFGWGPFSIGSRTDIGNWWEWFRGPDSPGYLEALYSESKKNTTGPDDFPRLSIDQDPGGENQVIVFESGFANSALTGRISDTVPLLDQNPLRGEGADSPDHTLANAKAIYLDLLNYFRQVPQKLFVVVTAPPLAVDVTTPSAAANARALNTWLVKDWLKDYPYTNVAVFDRYNVLTDLSNHHRYANDKIEYTADKGGNYAAYASSIDNSLPNRLGNEKSTTEFVPLLNVFYNRWQKAAVPPAPTPTAGSTTPQPGIWSAPLTFPAFGWFPDVAADSAGNVHVVWSTSRYVSSYGFDVVLHSVSKDGQQWEPPNDIVALPQMAVGNVEVTRPALLSDPRGVLHMTFREDFVYYSQAPDSDASLSKAWRAALPLESEDLAYFSRLAMDRQGRLHVVFTRNASRSPDCPDCYHLYYSHSEDGLVWTRPVDIGASPNGSAKPQILVDDQNVIHVVWEAGQGGTFGHVLDPSQVQYSSSSDDGATWTAPQVFSPPVNNTDSTRNIAIGQDKNGNLVIVWLKCREDRIYYQVSTDHGRSWSAAKIVAGLWGGGAVYASTQDDYAMATDSAGGLHLILVGRISRAQRSLSVLHLVWDSSVWSSPEILTTLTGDVPEWPRLAIGNGNRLYAVWFVRGAADIYTRHDRYRVWFSQSLASAPSATPVPGPTLTLTPRALAANPTPTVTAAATQLLPVSSPVGTAGPAPSPTFLPEPRSTPVYSENQYLVLIVKSLVPVVLVLVVIGGIGAIWQRRRR